LDPHYRLGITLVLGTVLLAAGLAPLIAAPPRERAAHDLASCPNPLGSFRLTERSGRIVTDTDLADRVWIAAFIFTRCKASCPRITSVMKGLQDQLGGTGVRLVSISVDPDHDTPHVLAEFARRFGAEGDRWWFLTGPKFDVYDLILHRFFLGVAESSAADQREGTEAISHSSRLALVDRGNQVVGYYDADNPAEVRALLKRARQLDGGWVGRLPTVNAGLNASCGVLLLLGWGLIRARKVRAHVVCMACSVVVSLVFLTCYLVYHAQVGSVPFRGVGPIRFVYFTILLSHTVLAAAVVPLILVILARALRRRFDAHVRIARVTFPIWLYVSITGVLVYLMLYRLDVPTSLGA
jgi:protein SCO1/2